MHYITGWFYLVFWALGHMNWLTLLAKVAQALWKWPNFNLQKILGQKFVKFDFKFSSWKETSPKANKNRPMAKFCQIRTHCNKQMMIEVFHHHMKYPKYLSFIVVSDHQECEAQMTEERRYYKPWKSQQTMSVIFLRIHSKIPFIVCSCYEMPLHNMINRFLR